jgi:hypothetical protein
MSLPTSTFTPKPADAQILSTEPLVIPNSPLFPFSCSPQTNLRIIRLPPQTTISRARNRPPPFKSSMQANRTLPSLRPQRTGQNWCCILLPCPVYALFTSPTHPLTYFPPYLNYHPFKSTPIRPSCPDPTLSTSSHPRKSTICQPLPHFIENHI